MKFDIALTLKLDDHHPIISGAKTSIEDKNKMTPQFSSHAWKTIDDANVSLQTLTEHLGFSMFAVAMQKYYPCGKIIQAAMSSYPIEWLQCYVKKNYILIDPVIKQTLLSSLPFKWADLDYRSRRAQALIKDARTLGITNGITVPMYTQDGEKFLYSLAGGDSTNLAGERLDQIYSTVYLALCGSSNALRHLFLSRNEVPPTVSLTKAQCEVLQMLMQGNTAKQVARTLGIHIRAVEDRIARACERLKANSRTQALVRALSTGQISLLSPQSQKMSTQDWYVHVPKKTETERNSGVGPV